METTPHVQPFYREEADQMYPRGCQCWWSNSGDCDWCQVYYEGPTCPECGEARPGSARVLANMKCELCAGYGG